MLELDRRKILIVDDDSDSQQTYERLLQEHTLVFVETAHEALAQSTATAFDAFIITSWFKDWHGPGLCRELRKGGELAPIVFCSVSADQRDRPRALRAGADAYLTKPVQPYALKATLEALIEQSDARSRAAKERAVRAIEDELNRHAAYAREHPDTAKSFANAGAGERTARAKALRAFTEAQGTRAHFERWWPKLYASVQDRRTDVR